ncbi:MAG: hypothetical protein E6Q93_01220 [Burkholderiaceae bacterium]|nr:MAG: hypothetical protein E6Q93_01220 [Burkholderiaceae bacterium]
MSPRHDLTLRRRAAALVAALLGALAAPAQAQGQSCHLVFGQARNGPAAGAPDWEALNQDFNTEVAHTLEAAGRHAESMTVPALTVDPQTAGLALLQRADELGCRTLVETTVFADEQQTLVLRLRVYPLLLQLDERASIVGLRIGSPLFVTQRELTLAALPRLQPEQIARQMTDEYLQHDRR